MTSIIIIINNLYLSLSLSLCLSLPICIHIYIYIYVYYNTQWEATPNPQGKKGDSRVFDPSVCPASRWEFPPDNAKSPRSLDPYRVDWPCSGEAGRPGSTGGFGGRVGKLAWTPRGRGL